MLRRAHILELSAVALLALAVLTIHSAGFTVAGGVPAGEAASRPGTGLGSALAPFQTRHAVYGALAVATMLVASRIDVRELLRARGWANPLWIIVLGALAAAALTLVPGMGRSVNGASRWLYLGPRSWGLSFQPSELVKWVMVLAVAWWCARRRGVMHRFGAGLAPPLVVVGLGCGLVVVEDLGTAVLIGAVAVCLLWAGGARLWQLGLLLPPAALGVGAAVLHSPYRVARLTAFADPWADPVGAGYHPIQSMIAFAQGGLAGRGLGHGLQKYYLPEDTTDFLFPVLAEELGLAGAALVVVLYLAILWSGLGIVRDSRDGFGRLLALGVLLTLGLQAAMNLAVVTVMVPTKGIALPLLSAGGTGWVLTGFALGLVASLDRASALEELGRVSAAGRVTGGGRALA